MNTEIKNKQGEKLDYVFHGAEGGAKAIVVVGHGVTGNLDRPWAEGLCNAIAAKITTTRFDRVYAAYRRSTRPLAVHSSRQHDRSGRSTSRTADGLMRPDPIMFDDRSGRAASKLAEEGLISPDIRAVPA